VFRGQILSFGSEMFGPSDAPLSFHERPALTRESLVLPAGVLETIEAQVAGVARHRSRLVASGQHLKRGVLLHGPPGTGKTHTLRYLMSLLTDNTVVMLSGDALQFIAPAVSIARALQPALVIVEDVDLIAEERGMHPGQHPLLFELLNEIDGLGEDADVTFLLTTNRADLLEPALAQRPGRVDQAVELPLPDAEGRRRLLELYRGNLDLQLSDTEPIVAQTDGMTASFFKELLRRGALISAENPQGDGVGALTVNDAHLRAALDQLLAEQNQLTRSLLGARRDHHPQGPASATDWPVAFTKDLRKL
jgi:ATP-dependent 26S proteasome regulatory subunit